MGPDEITQKNQMTQGYRISPGATKIGVKLWCQRLGGIFIGSAHKRIHLAAASYMLFSAQGILDP